MENEQADAGQDGPNTSRETKFSGANGDREIFVFPVQLTTSRNGNLTPVDPYSAMCDHYILHTYIHLHNYLYSNWVGVC